MTAKDLQWVYYSATLDIDFPSKTYTEFKARSNKIIVFKGEVDRLYFPQQQV